MQPALSKVKNGFESSRTEARVLCAPSEYRTLLTPHANASSRNGPDISPPSGCSDTYSSTMLWRCRLSRSLSVLTTISGLTGIVQEAGVPGCPSISQIQSRQEPKGAS